MRSNLETEIGCLLTSILFKQGQYFWNWLQSKRHIHKGLDTVPPKTKTPSKGMCQCELNAAALLVGI